MRSFVLVALQLGLIAAIVLPFGAWAGTTPQARSSPPARHWACGR